MKIKHLLALAIVMLSASACSAAKTATRDVPVSGDINALVTSNGVNVIYTVASSPVQVKVTGPDDLVPMVKVVTKGKTLNIGIQPPKGKGKTKINTKNLKVYVSGPVIYAIKAYTSSDVKFTNPLNTGGKPLKLHADTSAEIEIPEVSSTGTVTIDADTSADIKTPTLRADRLTVKADTSADVDINTANVTALNLEADTSADIKIGTAAVGIAGARADTSAAITIGHLTARILDASADTGAGINVRKGSVDKAKAKADTGGSINLKGLTIANIERINVDTGGSVKTK